MKQLEIKHESIHDMVDVYTIEASFKGLVILFVLRAPLTPEDIATLQAMYSRSNKPIVKKFLDLLRDEEKLEATKGRIVGDTHKNYGHKSIGDLGHLLICYEGVSMLAAKAIQDSQLYAGQEASTRYISFDKQPFLVAQDGKVYRSSDKPHEALSNITERWRRFYLRALPVIQEHLFAEYPWEEQEAAHLETHGDEKLEAQKQEARSNYERAIKARAFDIIRGFLPAGCTTNLAWWTSISHASDHLGWLQCHPLVEVQQLAMATQLLLENTYPVSFANRKVHLDRVQYRKSFMHDKYYLLPSDVAHAVPLATEGVFTEQLNHSQVYTWINEIMTRPQGQELPYQIGECGTVRYDANLDFASFRDQQRHRAVVQRQGLLTSVIGFHEWYLDNLPNSIKQEAIGLLTDTVHHIDRADITPFERQYLLPMGMKIPTRIVGHLGKVVYMVELRAQTSVHPTYHANAYYFAKKLGSCLAQILGVESVPLYINPNVGEFSWKRGTQTIFVGGKDISAE